MNQTMFTWVPLYCELAVKIVSLRADQSLLLQVLQSIKDKELPMIALQEKTPQGTTQSLGEIDPFSFFASFNRNLTDQNRIAILTHLKQQWNLQAALPNDFSGIPTADARNSLFFPSLANKREAEDIARLWDIADIAHQAGPDQLIEPLFSQCVSVAGRVMLSMGLFWINPHQYVSLDKRILSYAKNFGIPAPANGLDGYRNFIEQIHQKIGNDYPQISRDAWLFSQGKIKVQPDEVPLITPQTRFWKISPGENAFLWDEWRNNGYSAIGWPELGDVTTMTGAELEARRTIIVNNPDKYEKAHRYTTESVNQVWRFAHDIKPGDRLVANRGTTKVLGIGVVTKPCEFHSEAGHYLHRLPVLWYDLTAREVRQGGWRSTLIELNREKFEATANSKLKGDAVPTSYPLNQILYGPPGTGKTYRTIERAVEIINSGVPGDHAVCKLRFDELLQEGRIGFITFHQSYSYEDFVEGIRPILEASRDGEARYTCRDGVLKEMALQAMGACLEPARPDEATFEDVWSALLDKIDNEPNWECPGLSAGSSFKINVTDAGNLQAENTVSKTGPVYSCQRKYAEVVWNALRDGPRANSPRVKQLVGNGHTNFIGAVVEYLKDLRTTKAQLPEQKNISPDGARSFLAGSQEYRLKEGPAPRYVLIIDEINRGNISKILGELITLLEDDKRLPGDNSLTVKLPYSGDRFALPANLYFLGTMNTADKSLALVDVALRRRFEFSELAPDWKVCPNITSEMRDVLRELNTRITLRKDREHRIGHAYFVRVDDDESFNHVFRYRVIPLLQEYFYNDWEGLRYVLGESKGKEGLVVALPNSKSADARNKWQWLFDAQDYDGTSLDCLKMLRINYGSGAAIDNEPKGGDDATGP